MLRRTYDWTMSLAGHRHALAALALVAFAERADEVGELRGVEIGLRLRAFFVRPGARHPRDDSGKNANHFLDVGLPAVPAE